MQSTVKMVLIETRCWYVFMYIHQWKLHTLTHSSTYHRVLWGSCCLWACCLAFCIVSVHYLYCLWMVSAWLFPSPTLALPSPCCEFCASAVGTFRVVLLRWRCYFSQSTYPCVNPLTEEMWPVLLFVEAGQRNMRNLKYVSMLLKEEFRIFSTEENKNCLMDRWRHD